MSKNLEVEAEDLGINEPDNLNNGHYSIKGGHYARGIYRKLGREVKRGVMGVVISIETDWFRRRKMRRIPENGKR